MRKVIHIIFAVFAILFTMLIAPSNSYASSVSSDVYGESKAFTATVATNAYPNGFAMIPGDMIYGSKSFSTRFVGHVAIVGPDYRIYHSTPAYANGRVAESLSSFKSRFGSDTLQVYRYEGNATGPYQERGKAAQWAQNNYQQITSYDVSSLRLGTITSNYCSKFVWQAYFIGAGVNIAPPIRANYYRNTNTFEIMYPSQLTLTKMKKITSFSAS